MMKLNGSTTFWIGLIVSGMAGLLFIVMAHSSEPLPHSEAASERAVGVLEVKLERTATEVEGISERVSEVKAELVVLRTEQRQSSEEILRAIRTNE